MFSATRPDTTTAAEFMMIGCLTCKRRMARTRGNCTGCYNRWAKAVKAGKTTWARLEIEGQTLPVLSKRDRSEKYWQRWVVAKGDRP